MVTHYVEDYDGERNDDAVDREQFGPVSSQVERTVRAKVVEQDPADEKPAAETTAEAKTKG